MYPGFNAIISFAHLAALATRNCKGSDPTRNCKGSDPTRNCKGSDPTRNCKGSDPTRNCKDSDPTRNCKGSDPRYTQSLTLSMIGVAWRQNKPTTGGVHPLPLAIASCPFMSNLDSYIRCTSPTVRSYTNLKTDSVMLCHHSHKAVPGPSCMRIPSSVRSSTLSMHASS